jgi:hypothetical protein
MGPYCKFCGTRCFCFFPDKTPEHILKAYGTSTIIATCPGGQEFERQRVGYCYNDILSVIRDAGQAPAAPSLDAECAKLQTGARRLTCKNRSQYGKENTARK